MLKKIRLVSILYVGKVCKEGILMKKLITLIMGLVMVMGTALYAETLMIQSVSGDVQFKKDLNGAWATMKAKDKIDDSYYVQVKSGGKVQMLSQSGSIVKIDTVKSARISDLTASMKGNSMYAKLNNIKNKISSKGSDSGNGPTAVAGVRGDNVYEQNKTALKHDLYWEQ
jgi:hypothetical protein